MCVRLLTGAEHRKGPEKHRWALHSLHSGSIHSLIPYTAAGNRGSELLKIWRILTYHGVWTTTCGLGWTWPIKIGHMATKCPFLWGAQRKWPLRTEQQQQNPGALRGQRMSTKFSWSVGLGRLPRRSITLSIKEFELSKSHTFIISVLLMI